MGPQTDPELSEDHPLASCRPARPDVASIAKSSWPSQIDREVKPQAQAWTAGPGAVLLLAFSVEVQRRYKAEWPPSERHEEFNLNMNVVMGPQTPTICAVLTLLAAVGPCLSYAQIAGNLLPGLFAGGPPLH